MAELREALKRDAIDISACDIRLKGSSAQFFSGAHKTMPLDRDAIIDLYRELRHTYPSGWQVNEIIRRLHEEWIDDHDWPSQRPFDSMYRLGISREKSDIDLQISSDELVRRCEGLLEDQGQAITAARLAHPTYNFVRKDLVEEAARNLYACSLRLTDALRWPRLMTGTATTLRHRPATAATAATAASSQSSRAKRQPTGAPMAHRC